MLHHILKQETEELNKKFVLNEDKDKKKQPKEVIQELISVIEKNEENIKLLTNALLDILKDMEENLFDENGSFIKPGLLRWKNNAKYLEFADNTKKIIVEIINEINKQKKIKDVD